MKEQIWSFSSLPDGKERTKKFSLHAVSSIREELQIEFSQYEHPVVLTVEA
ncbi:hypothetical protein ES319_D12G225400v1 [Gossypium barbadense]|uniref:Uncharacterized protein n=1 Tax=Gossypium barbadense TaxID=3634 RepID=A0A5J5P2E7_GOSBA|nr:hypothetical protein ES319_D12G225400v1 [Gossypium barbadense]